MKPRKHVLQNVLIGATAVLFGGARLMPGHNARGPVMNAASAFVTGSTTVATAAKDSGGIAAPAMSPVEAATKSALAALESAVRPLSSPEALDDAFKAYFEYKTAHPDDVKKPYLYFVDYGLPSTTTRGYVFDMNSLTIVDGPFTVAHGRGSSTSQYGVPTRFSNGSGSAETSLGLYVTGDTYAFTGHSAGHLYHSIGLRLIGESKGFNTNAFARGVVAHGAPYVTPSKAGRSEGCPAMEPDRAERLLPKLAHGSLVFLFAPNSNWLAGDPWVNANEG